MHESAVPVCEVQLPEEFETVEVDARIVQIEDGRDWYSGTFEASADVTMIKK